MATKKVNGFLEKGDGGFGFLVGEDADGGHARAIINLPGMKDNYTTRLKRIPKEYAQIKLAEGQSSEAEQLDKEVEALGP